MSDRRPNSADPAGDFGEVPRALFSDAFVESAALLESYGAEWAVELAHRLGLTAAGAGVGTAAGPEQMVADRGFVAGFAPALGWLLATLAGAGLAEETTAGGECRYRLPSELRPAQRSPLRRRLLELDAANEPSLELLDRAGEAYPAVAAGERRGEEVLLGPAATGLWAAYFSNHNPQYAINNRIAAVAVANRLPPSGARVLEVGAGGGSASEALLAELAGRGAAGRLASYRITEISPFFRRRAERALGSAHPGLPLSFAGLDVDRLWAEQGIEAGSQDLVWGVNVLHVARDLPAALAEARRSLAPGGWLVAGECLRRDPDRPVAVEMVFQLLEDFTAVGIDPQLRPHAGFLTPEIWHRALAAAGFAEVETVPDVARIRDLYPELLTGALCACKGS